MDTGKYVPYEKSLNCFPTKVIEEYTNKGASKITKKKRENEQQYV